MRPPRDVMSPEQLNEFLNGVANRDAEERRELANREKLCAATMKWLIESVRGFAATLAKQGMTAMSTPTADGTSIKLILGFAPLAWGSIRYYSEGDGRITVHLERADPLSGQTSEEWESDARDPDEFGQQHFRGEFAAALRWVVRETDSTDDVAP